jgi:hypothetical protein
MGRGIIFTLEGVLSLTLLIAFIALFSSSQGNIMQGNEPLVLLRLSKLALDIGELTEIYNNSTTPGDIGMCSSGDLTGSAEIFTYPDSSSYPQSINSSYWLRGQAGFKRYNVSVCFTGSYPSNTRIGSAGASESIQAGLDYSLNISVVSPNSMDLTLTLNSSLLNETQTLSCPSGSTIFSFTIHPNESDKCYGANLTLNGTSVYDMREEMICTKGRILSTAVSIPEYPSLIPIIILVFLVIMHG